MIRSFAFVLVAVAMTFAIPAESEAKCEGLLGRVLNRGLLGRREAPAAAVRVVTVNRVVATPPVTVIRVVPGPAVAAPAARAKAMPVGCPCNCGCAEGKPCTCRAK